MLPGAILLKALRNLYDDLHQSDCPAACPNFLKGLQLRHRCSGTNSPWTSIANIAPRLNHADLTLITLEPDPEYPTQLLLKTRPYSLALRSTGAAARRAVRAK